MVTRIGDMNRKSRGEAEGSGSCPRKPFLTFEACLAVFLMLAVAAPAAAAPSVSASVRPRSVLEGEQILLEITVSDGKPGLPDVSSLKRDFTISDPRTGQSSSVSIINGRMTSVANYTVSYVLVPKKTGALTIPAITVKVDGAAYKTKPVAVTVAKASAAEKVGMAVTFNKNTCYAGEPVIMTVEISSAVAPAKIENVSLPVTDDSRFDVVTVKKSLYSGEFQTESKTIGGETLIVNTAKVLVIPREPGAFRIDGCSASCLFQTASSRRRRDPFDSFFNDGFFGSRSNYKRRVASAPSVTLTVRPLPDEGKPADFSGIIGRPTVSATARPNEVSVGQPIDFVIRISGLPYLGNIPPLVVEKQPQFSKNFQVQDDGLGGSLEGSALVFRRTLRAKNDKVKEIPPYRLSYFDPDRGKYSYTEVPAIPLRVDPTKVVSVDDGTGKPVSREKIELETSLTGIAGNEIDLDVLENRYFAASYALRKPGWLAATTLPLIMYLTLLIATKIFHHRKQDGDRLRMRKAYGKARKAVRALSTAAEAQDFAERLGRAICEYVGDRLGRKSAALTPVECSRLLAEAGVPRDKCSEIESLLTDLEAARFGGQAGESEKDKLVDRALSTMRNVEKSL